MLDRQEMTGCFDRVRGCHTRQQPLGPIRRDFLEYSARNELGQQGVQSTRRPVRAPPSCLFRFANKRNTAA